MSFRRVDFLKKLDSIDYKNKILVDSLIRVSENELAELNRRTVNDILQTDPSDIVRECYDTPILSRGSYKFRRRNVDTNASCFFSLKGGIWVYKDFGDSSNAGTGNILSLLQNGDCDGKNKMTFQEAVAFCVDRMHLVDYGREKIEEAKSINYYLYQQNEVTNRNEIKDRFKSSISDTLKSAEEKAINIKKENELIERESQKFSRVSYVSKIIPPKFLDFLQKTRGIETVPSWMYYIKGENFVREGETIAKTNNVEGVGVLTSNIENLEELEELMKKVDEKGYLFLNESLDNIKIGGDVHIIPYEDKYGNMQKTRSFGVGGITVVKSNTPSNKYFIAESKMDGAVADNSFEFDRNGYNLILANSTNNVDKVIKYLNSNKNNDKVLQLYNLNQNDVAGIEFTSKIVESCQVKKFCYINYEKDEYKQDGNDLVLNGNFLSDRLKVGTFEDYKEQITQMKEYLLETNSLTDKIDEKLSSFLNSSSSKIDSFENIENKSSYRVVDPENKNKSNSVRKLR